MRHDLGSIPGHNRPSPIDILSANRAANWRDFTALLAACCVVTFGLIGKDVVRIIWEAML